MILGYHLEGFIYLFVREKLSFVHEAIQPHPFEGKLYFAEHCFNRIQIWTVASIEDWHDV